MMFALTDIVVGKRYRQNIDDGINELCQSIEAVGQLQPILVDETGNLIAGRRRLRAMELLGRENIAVHVVKNLDDALKLLRAERDENTCRKDFTPSEAVEIGLAIEAIERPKAEKREKSGKAPCGNLPQGQESVSGKTRDKVGEAVGLSGRTYSKAKAVVAAAAEPDAPPEVIEAAKQMDATGKVDPAFKVVKAAKSAPAPKPYDVEADARRFQDLRDKLCENWSDEWSKQVMRQTFRQLANEV